jgi:hypothetical protein
MKRRRFLQSVGALAAVPFVGRKPVSAPSQRTPRWRWQVGKWQASDVNHNNRVWKSRALITPVEFQALIAAQPGVNCEVFCGKSPGLSSIVTLKGGPADGWEGELADCVSHLDVPVMNHRRLTHYRYTRSLSNPLIMG